VHEYGYRVEMDADQEPRFFDDRGRRILDVVPRTPGDDAGLDAIMRANAPLAITAATGFPRWDGNPVSYVWVIDELCAADRLGDVATSGVDSSDPARDVSAET
jgi:hypothetical protein